MISQRILEKTIAEAKSSPGIGRNNHIKLGASLFDGKFLITSKHNITKTHPILSAFSLYPYLHAEANAIISRGIDHCAHLSLIVVRVKANGSLSMAKPCTMCEKLINIAHIKSVYYTDWNGILQCK